MTYDWHERISYFQINVTNIIKMKNDFTSTGPRIFAGCHKMSEK